MKTLFLTFVLSLISLGSVISQHNSNLHRKADLHFKNGEWEEAMTDYNTLLTEDSRNLELYTEAIISSLSVNDYMASSRYVNLSDSNHITLDSLLINMDIVTRTLRMTPIYEKFMNRLIVEKPELKVKIDNYLLKHYLFRKENLKTIVVANELLEISPDDIDLLKIKANALFKSGHESEALKCFEQVITLQPQDKDAYIFIGNYYYIKGHVLMYNINKDYNGITTPNRMQYAAYKRKQKEALDNQFAKAAEYLEVAEKIRSTPMLKKILYDIYVQRSEVAKAEFIKRSK